MKIENYIYREDECYKGQIGLRRSNIEIPWTDEMFNEYTKCSLDYDYFIKNYYTIVTVDGSEKLFEPYPYQEKFLSTIENNRFTIILACRQSGKGTTVIGDILWCILFNDHYKVGYLANKSDVAKEMLERLKLAYIRLPFWMQKGVVEWNKTKIELENGSSVKTNGTTPNSARGSSLSWLILDEFSFVRRKIQLDFIAAAFPTITSGKKTRITIISTPNGMEEFHRIYIDSVNGKNEFANYKCIWSDVPGRDENWKQSTIKNIGWKKFNVEHNCEFEGSSNTLIPTEVLSRLVSKIPLKSLYNNTLSIYKEPETNNKYNIIVDVARGLGNDYTVFNVINISKFPHEQVAVFRSNSIAVSTCTKYLNDIGVYYNDALLLIELNDLGEALADRLWEDYEYENFIYTGKNENNKFEASLDLKSKYRKGVVTNRKIKVQGGNSLVSLLYTDKLLLNDSNTINELKTFIINSTSYAAEDGFHDDLAMTLILYAWVVDQNAFSDFTYENGLKQDSEDDIQFSILRPINLNNFKDNKTEYMSMEEWMKN